MNMVVTTKSQGTTVSATDMAVGGFVAGTAAWNRVTPTYTSSTWYLDGSVNFDASRSSPTYGRANATGDVDSVVPRSLSCKFCIKY